MDRNNLDAIKRLATAKKTAFETISAVRFNPIIGAEISGVDMAVEPTTKQVAEIRQALTEHHVLLFRDQNITVDQQKEFGRKFGTLRKMALDDIDGDDPEIVLIQANDASNFVAGEVWHTDGTASEEPAWAQILHIRETPEINCGGDTVFANMHLAYEMLSPGMKEMLDGMTAIHDAALPWAGYYAPPDLPKIEHPIVVKHPDTGKKMLYVNPGFTTRILQLSDFESRAILDMLFRYVDHEVALSCRVSWTPGTVVFWDNRCTQHRAIWDYYPYSRFGERVTLVGEKPYVKV
ncbi:MAG: TauD/TfdA dioxygenase family protein [Sulfitobacter sp.]